MGRVRNLLNVVNINGVQELARFCSNAFSEIQQIINGNISFEDNFRGKVLTVDFVAANVDTRILHDLGYVPTGYIVCSKSVALVDVYDGDQAATSTTIFLKSAVAGTVDLLIF